PNGCGNRAQQAAPLRTALDVGVSDYPAPRRSASDSSALLPAPAGDTAVRSRSGSARRLNRRVRHLPPGAPGGDCSVTGRTQSRCYNRSMKTLADLLASMRQPDQDIEGGAGPSTCLACGASLVDAPDHADYRVCPNCRFHYNVGARRRVQMLADPGSFRET